MCICMYMYVFIHTHILVILKTELVKIPHVPCHLPKDSVAVPVIQEMLGT